MAISDVLFDISMDAFGFAKDLSAPPPRDWETRSPEEHAQAEEDYREMSREAAAMLREAADKIDSYLGEIDEEEGN